MSWKFMRDRANSKHLLETSQPRSCNNFSNVNNTITCMIIWTRNKQPVLLKGTTDVELWNPSVNSSGHPLGPVILKPQRRRRWGSLCKTDLEIAGIFSFFEIGQQVDIVVHPQSGESRHPLSEKVDVESQTVCCRGYSIFKGTPTNKTSCYRENPEKITIYSASSWIPPKKNGCTIYWPPFWWLPSSESFRTKPYLRCQEKSRPFWWRRWSQWSPSWVAWISWKFELGIFTRWAPTSYKWRLKPR